MPINVIYLFWLIGFDPCLWWQLQGKIFSFDPYPDWDEDAWNVHNIGWCHHSSSPPSIVKPLLLDISGAFVLVQISSWHLSKGPIHEFTTKSWYFFAAAGSTGPLQEIIRRRISQLIGSSFWRRAVGPGYELGCRDWIHKPFCRQELIARVKAVMESGNDGVSIGYHWHQIAELFSDLSRKSR